MMNMISFLEMEEINHLKMFQKMKFVKLFVRLIDGLGEKIQSSSWLLNKKQ